MLCVSVSVYPFVLCSLVDCFGLSSRVPVSKPNARSGGRDVEGRATAEEAWRFWLDCLQTSVYVTCALWR